MQTEKLKIIVEIAKEKGFIAKTLTTQWTFNYLLGGKGSFLNDTCFYLLLCEVKKWLEDKHYLYIYTQPYYGTEYDTGVQGWELLSIENLETEERYLLRLRFSMNQEALEAGIENALKLIKNN